jgi:hypothetical protein
VGPAVPRPLSSGHIDTGARTFSAAILLAAAEACAQAGSRGMVDESLAVEIVDAAVNLVRSDDVDVAEPGARALAVAAGSRETRLSRLSCSPRTLRSASGGRASPPSCLSAPRPGSSAGSPGTSPPSVRAVAAHEAERTAPAAPREADAIHALADDPHRAPGRRLSALPSAPTRPAFRKLFR